MEMCDKDGTKKFIVCILTCFWTVLFLQLWPQFLLTFLLLAR